MSSVLIDLKFILWKKSEENTQQAKKKKKKRPWVKQAVILF